MSIGAKIKEQRAKLGISQQKLANAIGVSVDTIRSLEIDRANPSVETLNKLADLFEVSVDYLLDREEKVVTLTSVIESFSKIIKVVKRYDPEFAKELMSMLIEVPTNDEELKPEEIDENLIMFMSMMVKGLDKIRPQLTEDIEIKRKLIEKIKNELEETKKTPSE